ncbi:hypothetical protein FQN54_002766 [Arachnomyces sp. PD_36]|nr:hypothetical protein FQN54_002766 [Arachnomyces sp. PD_36]
MDSPFTSLDSMPATPGSEMVNFTISPSDTSLDTPTPEVKQEDGKTEEKKPAKKRKSWGQELPTPKTNLPPRKRAKTEDEKEQRRIERVLRNRAAAQTSRERKRLEVEKLEGEKLQIEQQNEFLLQRLAQMEAENNRLNKQVAQLSAEIGTSRGSTPHSVTSSSSPTLTATLFKQEREELSLDKIPFPTPSATEYSPSLKPSDLVESSDMTQHPAEMLCDLQCQSEASLGLKTSRFQSLNQNQNNTMLQTLMQLLCLTMTSAAYSAVILPLNQIFLSLKEGSPLTFSTAEIQEHFPLILWLISTPTLSNSTASSPRSVFRIQLLARLLACSPALARPLRDATSRALQLAASESFTGRSSSRAESRIVHQDWELLLTMIWAIDSIERSSRHRTGRSGPKRRRSISLFTGRVGRDKKTNDNHYGSMRRSRSSAKGSGTRLSMFLGKPA